MSNAVTRTAFAELRVQQNVTGDTTDDNGKHAFCLEVGSRRALCGHWMLGMELVWCRAHAMGECGRFQEPQAADGCWQPCNNTEQQSEITDQWPHPNGDGR